MKPNTWQSEKKTCSCLQYTWDFQQDNNPMHAAKATLELFKTKKLTVVELPSQILDLNWW